MNNSFISQNESSIKDNSALFSNQGINSLNSNNSHVEQQIGDSNVSNSQIGLMKFDANNPYYAQIFRYRYDLLTFEREKERDLLLGTRHSNFLINHYPPYGMFRAADELTKEKIVFQEFEYFSQQNDSDDQDSLNMVRLSQTAEILNSVLKEREGKVNKIKALNTQLTEFQRKYDERVPK